MNPLTKMLIVVVLSTMFTTLSVLNEPVYAEEFTDVTTTLDECIELGLEKNYKLKAKRTELKGVMLQADAIGISVLPKLDLKAGGSYTTPISQAFNVADMFPDSFWEEVGGKPEDTSGGRDHFQTSWGATLSANYPMVTPYVNKAIESELLARKEEVLSIADDARFSVTQAYMNALLMQRSQDVAHKSLELSEEQFRNAKLRYDNKVAAWFEVVQAEVQVSLAKESLEQTKNNLKNSLKALYLAMGLSSGPDEIVLESGPISEISEIIDEIDTTELPGFPDAYVKESYSFKQFDYSMQSLSNQVQASKTLPVLSGYATWSGQDGNANLETNSYTLGINLNFRLFDSGESKNKMEQLEVQKEILSISQQEFSQRYLNQLEVLSNNLQVALLTHETAKRTLDAATEGLKIATIGYQEGITTSLELMDSRTRYLSADLNVFSKKVAIFLAYDAIKHAIGYERYESAAVKNSDPDIQDSSNHTIDDSDENAGESGLIPASGVGEPDSILGSLRRQK